MQHCTVNKITVGGTAPVRIMGVINCSMESFYPNSYVPMGSIHAKAVEMVEQGAAIIDVGARSTAPNVQQISGKEEATRIDEALKELDGSGITVSVDTMHPGVLAVCLKHDVHLVNDIGGFASETYAKMVAESRLPAVLMASVSRPGDAVGVEATIHALSIVKQRCEHAGVTDYILDPGIGIWTPLRSVEDDWQLCTRFDEFQRFDRPLLAAISRKTFIGTLLDKYPEDRLYGSLAVTMMLLLKGASLVRTHDVVATADVVKVCDRMVKGA
ncbi:MAG: dihydropteroate synthase [Methanoregula sp.]|nr:MAG: dihydropteroate synthase [Methanoregula sp.]